MRNVQPRIDTIRILNISDIYSTKATCNIPKDDSTKSRLRLERQIKLVFHFLRYSSKLNKGYNGAVVHDQHLYVTFFEKLYVTVSTGTGVCQAIWLS